MLIINNNVHTKPYIVIYVGRTKFIINSKLSVLLIVYKNMITVYKNNALLGQISDYEIYTECDQENCANTIWNNYMICGMYDELPHNIPFYVYPNGISIFGYMVTQYRYDKCRDYAGKFDFYNLCH